MKLSRLLTEQLNPASSKIDALDTLEMLRVMNNEDRRVPDAVAAALHKIAEAVNVVVAAFEKGGRLVYVGAGTSGRLGVLDASECPPTFGVPPTMVQGIIAGGLPALAMATEASEDDPRTGAEDIQARDVSSADVVAGIAASGRTPYVLGAMREARRVGAATVGISCTTDSELSAAVDIPIELLVGPEVIAGSTRLKAGTATKLVLNMITTGAMIRMGYVYGNLMVNVQTRNEKLVDRGKRIVAAAAEIDTARASSLLEEAGGNVRVAIVMAKLGLGRAEAEERLGRSGGRIREALGAHR